ncbi:MAG TPA: EVE domain-containing protein [Pseudolabrys sp.]|jgi:predicted RNA-binding protein with PUA-like domain
MSFWLLKSEPDVFSWDDLVKRGPKGEPWTGIRNHTAKLNMMKMKKGEHGFFYHSNIGKEIVGICEVVREAYPDPTAKAGEPWVCVDVKAVNALKTPVTLAAIKAEPKLAEIQLLRQSRLSLPAIAEPEWKLLCRMGGL